MITCRKIIQLHFLFISIEFLRQVNYNLLSIFFLFQTTFIYIYHHLKFHNFVSFLITDYLNICKKRSSYLSAYHIHLNSTTFKMNMAQLSQLNLDEIQILAAAAAAANATQLAAAQQANASQSASNSVASISRTSHHGTSGHNNTSRQATPPVTPGNSNANTPKASASSTRTPTPTQNGISVSNFQYCNGNCTTYRFLKKGMQKLSNSPFPLLSINRFMGTILHR